MGKGPRYDREIARAVADMVYTNLEPLIALGPDGRPKSSIVGSYRRGLSTCHDVDFVFIPRDGVSEDEIVRALGSICDSGQLEIPSNGWYIGFVRVGDASFPFNVWTTTAESWGACLLYSTGSRDFNKLFRGIANRRGLTVNETGVRRYSPVSRGPVSDYIPGAAYSERAVCRTVGVDWIPPSQRTGERGAWIHDEPASDSVNRVSGKVGPQQPTFPWLTPNTDSEGTGNDGPRSPAPSVSHSARRPIQ